MTITKTVWRVDIAGMQLSVRIGVLDCSFEPASNGQIVLTAGIGIDLPLMLERHTLEEGDHKACDVCDRKDDQRHPHEPFSVLHTLASRTRIIS